MAIFEQFPYTNLHELNLDYILETQKKQEEAFTGVIEDATDLKDETKALRDETAIMTDQTSDLKDETLVLKNQTSDLKDETEALKDQTAVFRNQLESSVNQIGINTRDIAVNSARIDEFTHLTDGSTSGDAELADIRIGYSGKTYDTAGDAVRGQFSYLADIVGEYDTFALSTQEEPGYNIDLSKYWGYKINVYKNTHIDSVDYEPGAHSGYVDFFIAKKVGSNYEIVKTVSNTIVTANTTVRVAIDYTITDNSEYIVACKGTGLHYTTAGTGPSKLMSLLKSDNTFVVNENLNTWGLQLNINIYTPDYYLPGQLIKVSKTGDGFKTINDALDFAKTYATRTKPVTILIYPGEYKEVVIVGGQQFISLVGVNRDTCIIRDDTGLYGNCPLRIEGQSYVANLSLISTHNDNAGLVSGTELQANPSYGLHIDDRHADNNDDYVCTIENCYIYSNQNPAIGIGLDKNQTVKIINCEIVTDFSDDMLAVTSAVEGTWGYKPDGGAVFYHALYSGSYTDENGYQKLMLKDNLMQSNIPNVVKGEAGGMMNQVEFIFTGNSGYSTNNGRVWNNPLTGTTLNPISSQNNIDSMNYTE